MNKLVCSFKSHLPNEIDFAMQVATLLANTDNFTWSKDYQLVDAICSSLHVFTCICGYASNYCDCYPKFWHKILDKRIANDPHIQAATVPPDTEQSYLNFDSLIDHDLKDHNRIYKRIKTAAELIKQFSMTCGPSTEQQEQEKQNDEENSYNFNYHQMKKKKLRASPSLLKFVSLLLQCDDTPLNLIGLDILSNTASKLSKIPDATNNDATCAKLVQMFQEQCIDNIGCQDGDIYIIIRSIEVVSKLISSSSSRVSSNIINLINERGLLVRIEQLLTSRNDVNLFLATLECCYRISRHQPHLIAAGRVQHLIKILVNLLNCEEKQFFTPNALKRIKLVDSGESIDWTIPLPNVESKNVVQVNQSTTTKPQNNHQKASNNLTNNTNHLKTNNTVVKEPVKENGSELNNIPPQPPAKEYTCEWNNCNTKFTEAKQVYTHVFEVHIGSLAPDALSSCQWSGPNGSGPGCLTKRPKYSLLTHLNDFHCNTSALERALSKSEPIKPPEHPGYGPNAALLAIRRHANIEKNGSRSQNHSPLSVSVRLTAALILRNLATVSSEMKHALENHEPLLSEICMTNGRDESKIIAECLSLFSSE